MLHSDLKRYLRKPDKLSTWISLGETNSLTNKTYDTQPLTCRRPKRLFQIVAMRVRFCYLYGIVKLGYATKI
jgi:hypothetical protein